jgi:hypothetical protein
MPLTQNPIVEWPKELQHLLGGIQVVVHEDGKRYGRVDIDIDPETLFLLNDFEARVRHRQVRIRPAGTDECLVGEMNALVGLGAAAGSADHASRVRISFHDLLDDDCIDRSPQM